MTNTKKKSQVTKEISFKESILAYLKEVKAEWNKVTWPERRQVLAETIIVLGVIFFFTVLVYVLDIIFRVLLGLIPSR